LGIDVSEYTLRDVDLMVTAKRREMWDMTSHIMKTILSSHGVKHVNTKELNPFRQGKFKDNEDSTQGSSKDLAALLVK
jgi:hypothetical protein